MYSILLVDDETLVKISLQNMIQSSRDFTVTGSASNGQEALDSYLKNPVDAVITDLQMPVMGGVTLISKLRELGFRGPILALSNYSDFELVRGAMKAGAFDYLLKADISSELVSNYLQIMKKQIQDQAEYANMQQNYVQYRTKQQKDLFLFAFRQYLLNPDASIQEGLIARGIPDSIFPATFLHFSMDIDHFGAIPASQFVESALLEIMEDASPVFTAQMSDNELVVLIGEESIRRQKLDLDLRITRLFNMVRAYSMHSPAIIRAQGISSFENTREYYQLCKQMQRAELSKGSPIMCIDSSNSVKNSLKKDHVRVEILQILQYVNNNYMNKISLDDVSAYVHLNKEYLCRLFKKETGRNLFQYICDVRMVKAADLLTSKNVSVNAVSQMVGFSSSDVFSKRFKEHFGVSPASYVTQKNAPD